LKDESLGVGNERYLYVGICKKCGAVVDFECWPLTGSMIYGLAEAARVILLIVAFAVAFTWLYPMLK
jgi:hypothetical protein